MSKVFRVTLMKKVYNVRPKCDKKCVNEQQLTTDMEVVVETYLNNPFINGAEEVKEQYKRLYHFDYNEAGCSEADFIFKKKLYCWYWICENLKHSIGSHLFAAVCFILVFAIAYLLKLFGVLESFQQFVVVVISAAATYVIVCVTMNSQSKHQAKMQQQLASKQSELQKALMEKQSENETAKEKNIRIYEKKLEVYSKFNAMLWSISDKESFEKVKDMCMKELIFVISEDKIADLTSSLEEGIKNFESIDMAGKSYAKITALLREDLQGKNANSESISKTINQVYNAISKSQDEVSESENRKSIYNAICNSQGETSTGSDINVTVQQSEAIEESDGSDWNRPETKEIWTQYENNEIRCWHFNAFEVATQKKALDSGNMFLSLIEYAPEEWRTERLKQVQKGDAVFLFNRGGAGYVGLYRATGTIILRNEDEKILLSEDGGDEREVPKTDATKYDIYNAIDEGATLVSDIKVEPILIRNHSWNPIGTMRQTIVRPNENNVWQLLKYFDKEDK